MGEVYVADPRGISFSGEGCGDKGKSNVDLMILETSYEQTTIDNYVL